MGVKKGDVFTGDVNQKGEIVPIFVDDNHPLLNLRRSLPGEELVKTMKDKWREAGKNVDGSLPGPLWDTELYSNITVLMLVKEKDSREMEKYLAENGVARKFISRNVDKTPQIRDHSNIARALAALGNDCIKELNILIVKQAVAFGFGDPRILSGDTTAQELPIGYPNEPGILRGLAERCQRALVNLKKKGKQN